jgi:hypothetical protein
VALRKHRDDSSVDVDERELLREQRDALDGLRRQLAERVQAVEAREQELREAIGQARAGTLPAAATSGVPQDADASLRARLAEIERRERAVAERERSVARTDETTAETGGAGTAAAALAERERALAARERELEQRASELDGREGAVQTALPAEDPSTEQLERIERRMVELKEAESMFMRTRRELAARSDAVAQRERLVAQRERELDEREDGAWERSDVAQLEARLRRLEQHERETPDIEQTQGFSGGFRKLSEEGTRRPPNG